MSVRFSSRGFTIVELLIVIVVIGVLAAVVVVAYSGIQKRAQNTARLQELKAWQGVFEAYKVMEGNYPAEPDGTGFCLGTGFPTGPNGGGVARCRDYDGTGPTSYAESDNTALMTELGKAGRLPSVSKVPVDWTVGPWVEFGAVQNVITAVIEGGPSDCPSWTTATYTAATKQFCAVILPNS